MVRRVGQRLRRVPATPAARSHRVQQRLRALRSLVERVVAQTDARVCGGDVHVPDKVLSVFEPHTEAIRKGKMVKPTEFGNLITIQEAEHQIISAYDVHGKRAPTSPCGRPRSIAIRRSLAGRRIWRSSPRSVISSPGSRLEAELRDSSGLSITLSRFPRLDVPNALSGNIQT